MALLVSDPEARAEAALSDVPGDSVDEKLASLPAGSALRRTVERELLRASSVRLAPLMALTHDSALSPDELDDDRRVRLARPGSLFVGADGSWWRRSEDGAWKSL